MLLNILVMVCLRWFFWLLLRPSNMASVCALTIFSRAASWISISLRAWETSNWRCLMTASGGRLPWNMTSIHLRQAM